MDAVTWRRSMSRFNISSNTVGGDLLEFWVDDITCSINFTVNGNYEPSFGEQCQSPVSALRFFETSLKHAMLEYDYLQAELLLRRKDDWRVRLLRKYSFQVNPHCCKLYRWEKQSE